MIHSDILNLGPDEAARLSGTALAYAIDLARDLNDPRALEVFTAEWDYRNAEFGTPEWCDR